MRNQNNASEWKKLKDDPTDPTVRASNQFAKEILIPKKLTLNQMRRYKQLLELIRNQKIEWKDVDVDNLIWFLSQDLGVGRLTAKYRLLNLKYIVEG